MTDEQNRAVAHQIAAALGTLAKRAVLRWLIQLTTEAKRAGLSAAETMALAEGAKERALRAVTGYIDAQLVGDYILTIMAQGIAEWLRRIGEGVGLAADAAASAALAAHLAGRAAPPLHPPEPAGDPRTDAAREAAAIIAKVRQ